MAAGTSLPATLIQAVRLIICLLLFLGPVSARWLFIRDVTAPLPLEFTSLLVYLVDIPAILAAGLWLLAHLLDPARPLRLDPWFISGPLLALTVLALFSVLWADSRLLAAGMGLRFVLLLALYMLARNEVNNWQTAAWALAAGMTVQALISTAQFIQQDAIGLSFLGEMTPVVTIPWVRAAGLALHPNIMGGYLLLGLMATFALALQTEQPHLRRLLLAIFGIGVSGLLSTFSRSAWLGAVFGMGLAAAVIFFNTQARARWLKTLLLFGLVGGIVCLIHIAYRPNYFLSRIWPSTTGELTRQQSALENVEVVNLSRRQQYAQVAWQLTVNHFPLGVGGANFSLASYRLNLPASLPAPDMPPDQAHLPVHNIPLLVTAELGLLGGLSWGFLWLATGLALWRRRAMMARAPLLLGWSMAVVGLAVISFFDFYLWSWQSGRVMLWLMLGLWAGCYEHYR